MAGEAGGVDGGRGDDHLQVGATGEETLEVAQKHVDVEAPLVGFVHDDRVVAAELPVPLQLGQQDPVGHHLDGGGLAHPVGEPHRIPDGSAQIGAKLLGHPLGHRARRHPPRLGVADPTVVSSSQLEAQLG